MGIKILKPMKQFDLKAFRAEKNLTQTELARIFGCNQNFISRIESGERPIPQDKLDILQRNYGDISKFYVEVPSVVQRSQSGDNINGNHVEVSKTDSGKLLEVILQQSAQLSKSQEQLSKSQEQLSKSQEQIDRLISIIEKK